MLREEAAAGQKLPVVVCLLALRGPYDLLLFVLHVLALHNINCDRVEGCIMPYASFFFFSLLSFAFASRCSVPYQAGCAWFGRVPNTPAVISA